MNIHSVYGLFLGPFRRRRMANFARVFELTPTTRILDIGGTPFNWNLIGCRSQITILNLTVPSDSSSFPENFSFVKGDGRHLQFTDDSFDIAYSNSVIEHLHSFENQKLFAGEAMRVSKNLWVQTPSRWFLVELHLITPFIHYLPEKWQRRLLRNFTVWGLIARPTKEYVDQLLNETRLLTYQEMKELFPGCEILREKLFLFTKSFIALRTADEAP